MKEDIFISYNWGVSSVVDRFYQKLIDSNYSVWRDIRNLDQTNKSLTLQLGLFKYSYVLFSFILKMFIINCLIFVKKQMQLKIAKYLFVL